MKMKTLTHISVLVFFLVKGLYCYCQANLQNGWGFPVHTPTPIHVLLVPVELHGGAGTNVDCDAINPGCFPTGQLPIDIDNYFDPILPTGGPTKYFSKYLYQASFGQCIVLGDYLDSPVDVLTCPTSIPNSVTDWTLLIDPAIRSQFPVLPLHYSTPLTDFDKFSLGSSSSSIGMSKPVGGNTKFDCVIYLIKNYPLYGGGVGYGLTIVGSGVPGVTATSGTDLGAVFGHTGDIASIKFIMQEFFHGLFGGNNWHNGTGAFNHTFFSRTRPWGIESQHGCSQVVSGYDRWIFNWNNPPAGKNLSISTRDINNDELNSDITIPSSPNSSTFVLRDFVTYGRNRF